MKPRYIEPDATAPEYAGVQRKKCTGGYGCRSRRKQWRIIMGLLGFVGAVVDLADAVVSPIIDTAEDIVKDITEEIK